MSGDTLCVVDTDFFIVTTRHQIVRAITIPGTSSCWCMGAVPGQDVLSFLTVTYREKFCTSPPCVW